MKTLGTIFYAVKYTTLLSYAAVGIAVGSLSGMLGIGGGILMVPVINLVWGRDIKVAIGTSLAVMIPTAMAGFAKHQFSYHNVDLALAGLLAVGAMVGSYCLGAPLAQHLPGETLKKSFGIALIFFGLYYAWLGPWIKTLGPQA